MSKNKHYTVTEKVVNVDGTEIFTPLRTLYPDLKVVPPSIVRD